MACSDFVQIPLYGIDGVITANAMVDRETSATVEHQTWHLHSGGYACHSRRSRGRTTVVLMHRVIMGLGPDSDMQVDHINRNRLDNRRENLRVVTCAENHQNRGSYEGSTSKHRGVWWSKQRQKWRAAERLNGKAYHLGYFSSEAEAAMAASAWRMVHMPHSVEV